MTVQIYGVPISRSISNIWAALEIGVPYENVPTGWEDNSIYGDAYRAVNPNARVPALKDGDFVLWESLAINLYLARKYGGPIAASSLEEEALAWQWSLWTMIHLERPLMRWAFNHFILDPRERDAAAAAKALEEARPLLAVLDGQLAKAPYLTGDRFTIADLNVGCAFLRPRWELDLSAFPNLRKWDEAVFQRPAAQQAWAIRVAEAKRLAG